MRAVGVRTYGGPEALEVVELPEPVAGAGQILLRVHAAAVNPTDTYGRNGARAKQPSGVWKRVEHLHVDVVQHDPDVLAGPLAVPTTAVYTRSDGVVHWSTCLVESSETDRAENVEVFGSHCGLGFNPSVASSSPIASPSGPMNGRGSRPPGICGHIFRVRQTSRADTEANTSALRPDADDDPLAPATVSVRDDPTSVGSVRRCSETHRR